MRKTIRKVKWGIWLHNITDERDDEWVYVYATSESEAKRLCNWDETRFTLGNAYPVKDFRKIYRV